MQEPIALDAAPSSGEATPSPPLRGAVRPLQWFVGALLMVMGDLLWLAPHHFRPLAAVFGDQPLAWGAAYLAAGAALAATAAFAPSRTLTAGTHLLAAALLAALAAGSATAARWPEAAGMAALALAVAFAPLGTAPSAKPDRGLFGRGLFALAAGLAALATGLTALALPEVPLLAAPPDPWQFPAASALTAAGLLLLLWRLLPAAGMPAWPAHLAVGLSFAAFGFVRAAPDRDLLAASWYGGLALAVGLAPWAAPRLAALNPNSLRTRLALALIAAAGAPVVLAATLTTQGEEQGALTQALAQQETLAAAFAQETADYVGLHRGAVSALAAVPGLLDLSVARQQSFLRGLHAIYPDFSDIALLDPDGKTLARSDDGVGLSETPAPVLDELRRTGRPTMAAAILSYADDPSFVLAAPVLDAGGTIRGVTAATLT
ncbi:MAG: cache domain-containing protein, partial [Chloroflexi bacterium]|nr:cache domain-containing protein [Chloroflexota bacterium]